MAGTTLAIAVAIARPAMTTRRVWRKCFNPRGVLLPQRKRPAGGRGAHFATISLSQISLLQSILSYRVVLVSTPLRLISRAVGRNSEAYCADNVSGGMADYAWR